MTKEIDFYFDFISPYTYLAYKKIQSLPKNIKINYKPILLGGLHNLQGIIAPAFIDPKLKHMMTDCLLIATKNKINFFWNSKFPINSLEIMRGYLSLELNMKELYMRNIFDAYWKNNLDLSDKKVLLNVLKSSNINPNMFFEKIKNLEIKEKLKNLTKQAHDQEIFGAPTFLVNGKIFWGQDRLDFALDEYNK